MSLAGLITDKDIANLSHDFRSVINNLLIVEASIHNVPLTALDLSTRENDPDAGVDALLHWPSGLGHEFLPDGEIALQYKYGKLPLTELETEFKKPGVQETLKQGGHYLLLVAHGYVPRELNKRRERLIQLCRRRRLDPKKCQILVGGHIAQWVCRHAAVIILPELRKGFPAFSTVRQWSQHPEFQNPWKPDDVRIEIASQTQRFITQDTEDRVVRIEGPAGVGKSRLLLQAVNERGLAERTLYAHDAADPSVRELLARIQGDPRARAIVVVDECDRDQQESLKAYAELAGGRLRLICVGIGDVLGQAAHALTKVFVLTPLSLEKTREALIDALAGAPPEVVDASVRLGQGYVKLAIFVGRTLLKQPGIPPTELVRVYDVREFLKRFVDPTTRRTLQALSLLARIGWEEELRKEAEAVAAYLSIPFHELRAAVKTLKDQGVVLPRGRYLYVSPDLLAVSAAADLWEEQGADLIRIVDKLPGAEPRRELLKRLAAMGQHSQVKLAVEKLLDEEGLFRSLTDLDDPFLSEVFRILASTLPEAATERLRRLMERKPRDELLNFRAGRRNVIWAIESLLRWPATSLTAARSLRALAVAENESFGNNATGVFAQYFQMYLSRSPLPFVERLRLLNELVEAGDESSRLLATRAAASGLQRYESRMGGNIDDLSGHAYPSEWRPQTLSELWYARREAIARLTRIAEGPDEAARQARKALVDSVFTLVRDGMADDAIGVLEAQNPENDEERRAVLQACKRLERDVGEHLSAEQKQRLDKIAGRTFEDSYFARLRRWVGARLLTDYNLTEGTGYEGADAITRRLAEEGTQHGISDAELRWLASREAENIWVYAVRLGELDDGRALLNRIVAVSPDDTNAVFLAGYVVGRARKEGEAFRDEFLDSLAATRPMLAFACTWRGEPSARGFARMIQLVQSHQVPPENLALLSYGRWTETLSSEQITTAVELMLTGEAEKVLDPGMTILYFFLEKRPEALEQVEPLVWKLLQVQPKSQRQMTEWHWGQLARRVSSRDPKHMVETVIGLFTSEHFAPMEDEGTMLALRQATIAEPVTAWELIGAALLPGGARARRLLLALDNWYGDLIPADVLISWAQAHQPHGPRIVASLVSVRQAPLPEKARLLILRFPDNRDVRNQLVSNLETGAWSGSFSGRIEEDLEIVKKWAQDPAPEIRSWANEIAKTLEKQQRRQTILEEEAAF